jgi:hypothetical protein
VCEREEGLVEMAHNYILQVTTGTEYDVTTHKIVPVNAETPVQIESGLMKAEVTVRIQVCGSFFMFVFPRGGAWKNVRRRAETVL